MEQAVHTPFTTGEIPAPNLGASYGAQYGAEKSTEQSTEQGSGAASIFGAIISLSLLLGLGVWGYKLAVRDVSGVPVVRALEGPMRIQPDDPGGENAAFQGYSVNAVASAGGAETPADTLALAPHNVGLAQEDAPISLSTTVSTSTPIDSAATQMALLADQLSDGVTPLGADLTDVTPTSSSNAQTIQDAANSAVAAVLLGLDIIPTSVPGVTHSPRPSPRPVNFTPVNRAPIGDVIDVSGGQPPQPSLASSETPSSVTEVPAANIPVGTRLVQLGAFESADIARAEWDGLMTKFEDYLDGKSRVIQEATSGGKTFFRLRAMGFGDLADTRRFCTVLIAGNALCIPVLTR